MKLPTQLWLSNSGDPSPELMDEPRNEEGFWKPRGCLWTSPLEDGSSEWWEWCQSEGFGDYKSAWILEPVDCRVATIATPTDLATFQNRYMLPKPEWMRDDELRSLRVGYLIDYEKAAEDWDAIFIPYPNAHRFKIEHGGMWFSSMDVTTALWLRWMFSDVRMSELPSPRRQCDAWTYHVGDGFAACKLDLGHEGMHKSGYFESSFEWSDSFTRHEKRA